MENASKALLMAAGVLIGILVLSLAVYLFITFGASSREINARIEDAQLTKFNAQFNVYADRDDITIYDIISLMNLAKENNDYYENNDNYKISIVLKSPIEHSTKNAQDLEDSEKQELIEEYSSVYESNGELEYKFKCEAVNYNDNGRIKEVIFKL